MSTDLRDFLAHAVNYFAAEGMDNPNLGDAQSILAKYSKFVALEGGDDRLDRDLRAV